MKFLILFLLLSKANATEWMRSKEKFNFLNGEINYLNRSACAERSKIPSKSAFLILDNVNFAKSAYRLAKIKNLDPVQTTNLAIEKFRYSLTTLISIISSRLLSKDLPFIEDHLLGYDYLESNWLSASIKKLTKKPECKIIKKFSSLYSHLNVSRPDHLLFEQMAKDMENIEETFLECEDFKSFESPEVAFYQFDFSGDKDFDKIGFKFWYSLKVYLSWAFRYSPEIIELSAPFDQLLRSVNLEEMVLFFSNGCESITPTQCTDYDLNLENLKLLTKNAQEFKLLDSDFMRPVPESPVNSLLSKPLPLLEDDLLNLSDFKTADAWVENFREQFLKVRGHQKIRLSRAFSSLYFISRFLSKESLMSKITKDLSDILFNPQEIYYLCSEYGTASRTQLSNLKYDLKLLRENSSLKEAFLEMFDSDFNKTFDFYENIGFSIKNFCDDLEKKNFWNDFVVQKNGFAAWYKQFIFEENPTSYDNPITTKILSNKPFLKISNGEVICQNGIQCARILLDSIMSLSAISKSISTVNTTKDILSSNMANPYSSSMACGAYDPWAKKNKIIYEFFHDLTQAAAFGLLPTPVYVSADLEEKKIVSFSSLIKDGKIFYDPKYDARKIRFSLISDLGPLIGVPCAVSISGSRINPLEYYTFNGISLSGCQERSKIDLEVSEDEDRTTNPRYVKSCASCAINLQTLSSAVTTHPVFRTSVFIVKGVVRLIQNLKDKNDLFKSWRISPQKVLLSYRYFGHISEKCGKKLLKGESCLPKKCESRMLEELTKKFRLSPVDSEFSCLTKPGFVEVKECPYPINVDFNKKLIVKTNCELEER